MWKPAEQIERERQEAEADARRMAEIAERVERDIRHAGLIHALCGNRLPTYAALLPSQIDELSTSSPDRPNAE